ncbi:hypothetical protein [Colwellia hornerae]|uniref:Uncharacterized protein n=1 Tax=Colwellia hornerae TaxID=89402 RepID=A0A5C6Q331_9GAMM|nr:hypothetical protein [Colwellia hornerae]TWX47176.1 hypothetical protein ESZ28_17900 [Colwellia hornerae]TWX54353.1 hypothetical protein ESZ26_17870 [Colwellia hornerae]TWX63243.1 hypothetical protein ESZ27_17455 [Colwellia hornerae]
MSILTSCKWFIRLCIPKCFSDDICGDLEEEYSTIVHSTITQSANEKNQASMVANAWLIKHTCSICTHFILSKNNLLVLLVSVVVISISFLMILSVFWLSNLADARVLSDVLRQQWLAGNTYQIFLEPILWQSTFQLLSKPVDWNMWFYQPAIIYALTAFYILYNVTASIGISIIEHLLVSIILVLLPYILGNTLFFFIDIEMIKTGPIVAFMWLSTLYLIIPLGYQLVNKIKTNDSCFT